MRYRLERPTNRYVFKSHLNCSESTAGSLRQSGSEFQRNKSISKKIRQTHTSTTHTHGHTNSVKCVIILTDSRQVASRWWAWPVYHISWLAGGRLEAWKALLTSWKNNTNLVCRSTKPHITFALLLQSAAVNPLTVQVEYLSSSFTLA